MESLWEHIDRDNPLQVVSTPGQPFSIPCQGRRVAGDVEQDRDLFSGDCIDHLPAEAGSRWIKQQYIETVLDALQGQGGICLL